MRERWTERGGLRGSEGDRESEKREREREEKRAVEKESVRELGFKCAEHARCCLTSECSSQLMRDNDRENAWI